ncbi:MAG TPA: methyltransferase [Myxococcales bacterium]|nr:methyltransferase [Myxococcales bacterium]
MIEAALGAAHELGLFAALPCPAAALAERLRVGPRRLGALVRVLLLDGSLVERGGELWPGPALRPGAVWSGMAEAIRTDRPLPAGGISGLAGEDLRRFHQHLLVAGAPAAREVAARLGPRGPLLDLGGGAGAYAGAFLAAHPGERALIADRPAVLDLARSAAPSAELLALDLLGDVPWPSGARVALLANVLHLHGPADAARLVARAAQAVVHGGTVAVKDFDGASAAGVLLCLTMALFTGDGEVHGEAALRSFFRDAGLREVEVARLRSAPEALLLRAVRE